MGIAFGEAGSPIRRRLSSGFPGTGQNAIFCIRGVVGEVPLDEVQNIEAFVIPEKVTEGAERSCHGPATAADRLFRT